MEVQNFFRDIPQTPVINVGKEIYMKEKAIRRNFFQSAYIAYKLSYLHRSIAKITFKAHESAVPVIAIGFRCEKVA
jgi:hypothetical protein